MGEPARILQGPWLKAPTLATRTADVFSRVLPEQWAGYAPREGQLTLTRAIADTISNGGQLLAEGPCGTGKTLAYLVPAIIEADRTGRTVLVVTASIALQEQLVQHDLPALAKALESELREPLTWTLLKGRGNYACFAGETRVITRDGIRRIDQLAGGEHMLLDGNGRWTPAPVKSYGAQPLMRLTLMRGQARREVFATPTHRWIVSAKSNRVSDRSEKTTSDLRPGDRLPVSHPKPLGPVMRPSPFGVAHGITFGDGTLFGETPGGWRTATLVLHGAKRALACWFPNSHKTVEPLVALGYAEDGLRIWDLPRGFKDLPSLEEAPSYLYGWLAGYFAADGCVGENGAATISSARREHLEFVQTVCLRLGIATGGISETRRVGRGTEETSLFTLSLVVSTLGEGFFIRERHAVADSKVRRRPGRDSWTVVSVEATDRVEEVFCAEVPTTQSFALDGYVLTGNCQNTLSADVPHFLSAEERAELRTIDTWARTTETGDRLELPMIVRDGVWAMRSVESDDCLRDGCDHFDACFARAAKARAEGVRVVVINYHLLFAHISVRRETFQDIIVPKTAGKDSGLAWDTVLCDEAHEAGDIARDFMGCDLTERGAAKVCTWLKRDGKEGAEGECIALASQIDQAASALWREMGDRLPVVRPGQRQEAHRLREGLPAEHLVGLLDRAAAMASKIVRAIKALGSDIDPDQRKILRAAENAERRARRVRSWLDAAVCPAEAPHTVLWLESHTDKRGHERVRFCGRLLDVGTVLREELFARSRAVVLSSATLTTGPLPALNQTQQAGASDAWHWIRQQLGLPATTPALAVASPFDFGAQALLCLPSGMGDPTRDREGFDARVVEAVEEVARAAGGRTLALFTSTRMAKRAAEHLRAQGLGFPVLCQGEQPRPHLLAAMKSKPSILCATTSFWTGVDLPGEAVVAVVLDKMPFPVMGDPVLDALSELAFARTGDRWTGWREESLPRATLALRQGAGRLIRSVTDWGVVVVCDPRLTSKAYGAGVIKSLGMPAQARSLQAVKQWFSSRSTS